MEQAKTVDQYILKIYEKKIDAGNVESISKNIGDFISTNNGNIVLDMKDVESVNTAYCRHLLKYAGSQKEKGYQLIVENTSFNVKCFLEISNIRNLLTLH
jgi:anti-anti-sigma factor